jgi:type IV pilus assembly protein PilX
MNNYSTLSGTRPVRHSLRGRQEGVILVISLMILMMMTLIAVTAMQGTTQEERMANNTRQRSLAFQAAEAGLRAGEAFLMGMGAARPVFDSTTQGLIQPLTPSSTTDISSYWMGYNWSSASKEASELTGLADYPHYVIEEIGGGSGSTPGAGGNSAKFGATTSASTLYRITSKGVGGTSDAVVILQAMYSLTTP